MDPPQAGVVHLYMVGISGTSPDSGKPASENETELSPTPSQKKNKLKKSFESAHGREPLLQAALPAKRRARPAHREHARKAQLRRCGRASQLRSQPQPASSGGAWRRGLEHRSQKCHDLRSRCEMKVIMGR